MMSPIPPSSNAINILLVDDSDMFRLMISRDMINKGFEQTSKTTFVRHPLIIYVVADYASAIDLLRQGSASHVDFSALFLDWHLSPSDRANGYDGAQIGVFACDATQQPLKPKIYCTSAESKEMRDKIIEGMGSNASEDRVIVADFMIVVDKILEVGEQLL